MPSLATGKTDKLFRVAHSPHLRAPHSTAKIFWGSLGAISPILIASVVFFGWNALRIISIALASALVFEFLFRSLFKKKIEIGGVHSIWIGALLAFLLPPTAPSWIVILGVFIAVVIGKEIFGGLGQNLFHPTLVAYATLLTLFPSEMTSDVQTVFPTTSQFFLGGPSEILGGANLSAIVVSGGILMSQKWISWREPLIYLAVVFGSTLLMDGDLGQDIFTGSIFLCAFFFVTDSVTIPVTKQGRALFSIEAGLLTAMFHLWMNPQKAMASSILLMNALVPLIDRLTKPQIRKFK